jgi:hypothetical protein
MKARVNWQGVEFTCNMVLMELIIILGVARWSLHHHHLNEREETCNNARELQDDHDKSPSTLNIANS